MRGFYYEGWHPHGKPLKERHKEEFLAHIANDFRNNPDVDPEKVAQGVFQVLAEHVTASNGVCLPRFAPCGRRRRTRWLIFFDSSRLNNFLALLFLLVPDAARR